MSIFSRSISRLAVGMAVAVLALFPAPGGEAFAAGKPVPSARVFNSSSQSIADSTYTILTFDSEDYDLGGLHDTLLNTSRLTAPVSGVYAISATTAWASGVNSSCLIALRLNGVGSYLASGYLTGSTCNSVQQNVSTQYLLMAGDYIEVNVYQSHTSSAFASADGHLEMTFVAPVR